MRRIRAALPARHRFVPACLHQAVAAQDLLDSMLQGQALFEASGAKDKVLVTVPGANHNDIFMRGLDRYLEAITGLTEKLS